MLKGGQNEFRLCSKDNKTLTFRTKRMFEILTSL